MKVILTGSACRLARALLPLLLADDRVEQVIGIDRAASDFEDARFTQVILDTRSPQIARVMAGMDVVVHLATAAASGAGKDREDRAGLRETNVSGGQNVFRCAAQQGISCIVHLASAAVYALPARRHPIDEAHPRAGLPGFAWSEDQVALEEWLDRFAEEYPNVRLVRLRPHLVVGDGGSALIRRLLRAPFSVGFAGTAPHLQCVHALDVARAVQQALFSNVSGAFNLACANAATLRDMQRFAGGGMFSLPFPLIYRLLQLSWRLGFGTRPAWLEGLRHELVLDTTHARRALGWKPQYDTVQACIQARD